MKLRIRYADQVVGIFVLLAIGMVIAMVVLLGANQRWWKTNYYFTTEFPSADGVAPGTSIRFKGFEIGKIESISLNKKDHVDVKFYIFEEYQDKTRENSVIQLVSSPIPGLGGGLVFHPGSSKKLAQANSFIPNYESVQAKELIKLGLVDIPPTEDSIAGLFTSVKDILDHLSSIMSNLDLAFEGRGGGDIGKIISSTKSSMDQLPGVMGNIDSTIVSTKLGLEQTMLALNETMTNIKAMTEAFKDPTGLIPKLLGNSGSINDMLYDNGKLFKQIDEMLANLTKSTKDIQGITGGLNAEIPKISSLILETRGAIQNAQSVLEGLKNNPLLKGGISEKPSQETKSGSLRSEDF